MIDNAKDMPTMYVANDAGDVGETFAITDGIVWIKWEDGQIGTDFLSTLGESFYVFASVEARTVWLLGVAEAKAEADADEEAAA